MKVKILSIAALLTAAPVALLGMGHFENNEASDYPHCKEARCIAGLRRDRRGKHAGPLRLSVYRRYEEESRFLHCSRSTDHRLAGPDKHFKKGGR